MTNKEQGPITERILKRGLLITEIDSTDRDFGYSHDTKQIFKPTYFTEEVNSPVVAVRLAKQLATHHYCSKHPMLSSLSSLGWKDNTRTAKIQGIGIFYFLFNFIPQLSVWKITKGICAEENVDMSFYKSERNYAISDMFRHCYESTFRTIWFMLKAFVYLIVFILSAHTLSTLNLDVAGVPLQVFDESVTSNPNMYLVLFPELYMLLISLWIGKNLIIGDFENRYI